jgi:ubiquinone/menaquinone biosynthesis C-methylase UbiE
MTDYIPAMGRHWMLFLYDPFSRVARVGRIHDALLDRASIRPGQRVLEIGCGTGNLLTALGRRRVPDLDVLGTDPDPAALGKARRKAARAKLPLRYERAYAGELPLPDDSVDRVLSSYMLHHLDATAKAGALREVRRVLRPGGELHLVDADGTPREGRKSRPLLAGNAPDRVLALMHEAGLTDAMETGRGQRLGGHVFYRARVSL